MPSADSAADWDFPNPATAPGTSTYYSLRFTPAALRDDLAVLHAWRQQIRAIPETIAEPGVAIAKLQWWREETERGFRGEASHPLVRRLTRLIDRHRLPPTPFMDVLTSSTARLSGTCPADFTVLASDAERDLGALFELVAHCHGMTTPAVLDQARRLGGFCTLVYLIRDSGWWLRRGRLGIIPIDRLAGVGLRPADLTRPDLRSAIPGLVAQLAADIDDYRITASLQLQALPVTLRIRVRLLDLLWTELKTTGFDLLDQRIGVIPIRKVWHAWRESRRRR